jgi:hypothetical protein
VASTISSTGVVGLSAALYPDYFLVAESALGCPTSFDDVTSRSGLQPQWAFAVHSANEGFTYGFNSLEHLFIYSVDKIDWNTFDGGESMQTNAAAISVAGDKVFVAVDQSENGGPTYELRLYSFGSDVSNPGTATDVQVLGNDGTTSYGLSACGDQCIGAPYIAVNGGGQLKLKTFDLSLNNPQLYDVKCGTSSNDATAASAWSVMSKELGVLWGNTTQGELYSCVMPP